jgi:arylsulfatase A-like enzyme
MNINILAVIMSSIVLLSCSSLPEQKNNAGVKKIAKTQPNILFIMADDLGKEWVSLYGGTDVGMPNLNALASEGVILDNAYVNPQCTPTRMSLLTGQYPFRNGWVNHWDAPRWGHGYYDWKLNPSLGQVMKAAGYATAVAGKWQVNDFRLTPDAMEKHGFSDYLMWTGYESGKPESAERYWQPYLHSSEGSRIYENAFGEDLFTDFLIDFIEQEKSQPWFVYYPMVLPHVPFTTTPDDKTAKTDEEKFHAMVRYVDKVLGRFTNSLERSGQLDNTIIIWIGDNGSDPQVTGMLGGRKIKGAKAKTIEAGINVPAVISAPGLTKGTRLNSLIDVTDFFPTFVELAGGELPGNFTFDGVSFASLLTGKAKDSNRQWIMAMGGQNRAKVSSKGVENEYIFRDRVIRDKRYKLYMNASPKLGFEKLVDLATDPEEKINLIESKDAEIQAVLKRLSAVAESFPQHDNDPKYRRREKNSWDVEVSVKSIEWKK